MEQKSSKVINLQAFYEDAQLALAELATTHGVVIPPGHVALEASVLHWRLSVHADSPEKYWADLWISHATKLGLGILIEPGDMVLDQEGRSWTLLGLDPSANAYPVRLLDMAGAGHMASIEAAQLFQVIRKAQADQDSPEAE